MNEFLLIVCVFLLIACIWYKVILRLEEERNNELQEQNEIMNVMYNALKVKIKRKKELLEIQDKLINKKRYLLLGERNYFLGSFKDKEEAKRKCVTNCTVLEIE